MSMETDDGIKFNFIVQSRYTHRLEKSEIQFIY